MDDTLSDGQSSATLANDASIPNNNVASSAHSHTSDDDAAGPGEDVPGVERCGGLGSHHQDSGIQA